MGNQVAGNLTDKYNQTKSGIDTSANDYINQINQGYTKAQDTSGMLANAVQTASDPNQVAEFQAQLNDAYKGPSNWADYGTNQGKVSEAQQYGGLVNTPGGTNVLAQGLEGPQASQGVNQLDTMLLNGSPGAAQAMQTAAKPFDTLGSYLDQYNTTGNNAIAANTAEANAAAQAALAGLTGAQTNLQGSVTGAMTKAQDAYNNINSNLAGIQGTVNNNGTLTPEQITSLGIDPVAYARFMKTLTTDQAAYGSPSLNAGNYFTAGTAPGGMPTAANSASANDYAQAAALNSLAGGWQTNPLQAQNASLAGTANSGLTPSKFDLSSAEEKAKTAAITNDISTIAGPGMGSSSSPDQLAQKYLADPTSTASGNIGAQIGYIRNSNDYGTYSPKQIAAVKRLLANDY
jgi:hypothetical protein